MVALGDVAGKGSPAALLMALLLAILRTLVDEGLGSSELVRRLNVQVARHAPPSRFITLFFGVYDPRTGELVYVNAGHMPPLLRREPNRTFERLESTGIALGMFEESQYVSARARLRPGDLLVLYSDGITEAETPEGQPFEEAGLERFLKDLPADDLSAAGLALFSAVEGYAQDTRFGDDLTVLLLHRTPQNALVGV
jgi:sigma-B regulation protein RsbU (phosphoserine phosphatase)